jgi:hypothetical protein
MRNAGPIRADRNECTPWIGGSCGIATRAVSAGSFRPLGCVPEGCGPGEGRGVRTSPCALQPEWTSSHTGVHAAGGMTQQLAASAVARAPTVVPGASRDLEQVAWSPTRTRARRAR